MRKFKTICIFGDSSLGKDEEFITASKELGKVLAARHINVVYGGGTLGLRGFVAGSALIGGSKILGIRLKDAGNIPDFILGSELRVSSMNERLGNMFYNAEAFIAMPGGLETLADISSLLFCSRLNLHKKPLGLLNINGFYDGLLSFVDKAVEQDFIPQATRRKIIFASTADQLIDQLQNCASESDLFPKQVDLQPMDSSKRQKLDTTLQL